MSFFKQRAKSEPEVEAVASLATASAFAAANKARPDEDGHFTSPAQQERFETAKREARYLMRELTARVPGLGEQLQKHVLDASAEFFGESHSRWQRVKRAIPQLSAAIEAHARQKERAKQQARLAA